MPIVTDGFQKDPEGDGGGGGFTPAGTADQVLGGDGVARALGATDMIWAVATTTRSSNAFSGDLAVAPASLATGLIITWRVPSAPSGASTYNLNSLGAKDIYVRNAAAGAADLVANRDLTMRYDGTRWQIIAMGTLVPGDSPHRLAVFQRITSDQTGVSGSFAPAAIAFNNEAQDDGGDVSINGSGLITFANGGRYRLTIHAVTTSGGYFSFARNRAGATTGAIFDNTLDVGASFTASKIFDITASDTVEAILQTSVACYIKYVYGAYTTTKAGCATFLEIERLK